MKEEECPLTPTKLRPISSDTRRKSTGAACLIRTQSRNGHTDVDVYNDKNPAQAPIQIPLDFTLDVEELQLPYKGKKAA